MKRLQATWSDTVMSDRRYRIILLLGLLLAFLVTWYFVYLATNESAGLGDGPLPFREDKIQICHYSSGGGGKYILQSVAGTQHDGHPLDVQPLTDGTCPPFVAATTTTTAATTTTSTTAATTTTSTTAATTTTSTTAATTAAPTTTTSTTAAPTTTTSTTAAPTTTTSTTATPTTAKTTAPTTVVTITAPLTIITTTTTEPTTTTTEPTTTTTEAIKDKTASAESANSGPGAPGIGAVALDAGENVTQQPTEELLTELPYTGAGDGPLPLAVALIGVGLAFLVYLDRHGFADQRS